jgi:putative ABC transport system permease protein
MNVWLSTFAFRVVLSPTVFLISGFTAALIAWLTVSYHFVKAAASNPCDAIRHE